MENKVQNRFETIRRKAARWSEFQPASYCTCGHTGDGANSQHSDMPQYGHGMCLIPNCPCTQFTWANFTPEYEDYRKILEKEN